MKELKTLHFPNEAEPREIVDAYARQRIANLTISGDAPVLDATLDANGIMTYNNSPAFDEWLTEAEGSEKFAPSGYGLGETNGKTCTDANTATKIGFYSMSGSGALNVPAGYEYGQLSVTRRNADIYQTLKSEGNEVHRHSSDGGVTWQPWSVSRGVDVVVAQGKSGIWTYRKWASGIAECWGDLGMTNPSAYTHALPFNFKNGKLFTTVKYHDQVGYNPPEPVNGWVTGTQIKLYTAASGVSSSATYLVQLYVIGTWK